MQLTNTFRWDREIFFWYKRPASTTSNERIVSVTRKLPQMNNPITNHHTEYSSYPPPEFFYWSKKGLIQSWRTCFLRDNEEIDDSLQWATVHTARRYTKPNPIRRMRSYLITFDAFCAWVTQHLSLSKYYSNAEPICWPHFFGWQDIFGGSPASGPQAAHMVLGRDLPYHLNGLPDETHLKWWGC